VKHPPFAADHIDAPHRAFALVDLDRSRRDDPERDDRRVPARCMR